MAEAPARLMSGNDVPVDVLQGVTMPGGTPMPVWLTGVGVAWLLVRHQLWPAVYVAVTAGGAMILGVVIEELVACCDRRHSCRCRSRPAGISPAGTRWVPR